MLRQPVLAAALTLGAAACATKPPPAPAGPPPRPMLLTLPDSQPEIEQLMALPALWKRELERTPFKLVVDGEPSGEGNFDELVGPLAHGTKRNRFLVVEDTAEGRRLLERRPGPELRKTMDAADSAFSGGKLDEALTGYRKVIEYDPLFAKAYFYVAAVLKQRRDFEQADAWITRGLTLDPREAFGYAMRAEMLSEQGKDLLARDSLARALALDPTSPPALRLLTTMAIDPGGGRKPGVRPRIFIKREGSQEVVARSAGHPAWRDYAVCRALLTYDRRVRAEFLQSVPFGSLSPVEETTCGYLVTATYRKAREQATEIDLDLERWSKAFDAGLLREAVIYDTLGCRRPELLQLLPDDVQVRIVEYTRIFIVPRQVKG